MINKTIALKLIALRKEKNLTQNEIAKDLNISRSVYSFFETGRRTPDISTLCTIAKYHGVSIDWLLDYNINDSDSEQLNSIIKIEDYFKIIYNLTKKSITLDNLSLFLNLIIKDYEFITKIYSLSPKHLNLIKYIVSNLESEKEK